MNSINRNHHHPDIELLLNYVSGNLEGAIALPIGLHHHHCEHCQEKVNELEVVGGNSLEALSGESLAEDDFEKLLQDLDSVEMVKTASAYEQLAIADTDLSVVQQLAEGRYDKLEWENMSLGIQRAKFEHYEQGYKVEVLKFPPHAKIPRHTHKGNEFTVVLEGDFSDEIGCFKSGDFIHLNATNDHKPIAGAQGCICLAVSDAPVKFTGAFGPFLNLFTTGK